MVSDFQTVATVRDVDKDPKEQAVEETGAPEPTSTLWTNFPLDPSPLFLVLPLPFWAVLRAVGLSLALFRHFCS